MLELQTSSYAQLPLAAAVFGLINGINNVPLLTTTSGASVLLMIRVVVVSLGASVSSSLTVDVLSVILSMLSSVTIEVTLLKRSIGALVIVMSSISPTVLTVEWIPSADVVVAIVSGMLLFKSSAIVDLTSTTGAFVVDGDVVVRSRLEETVVGFSVVIVGASVEIVVNSSSGGNKRLWDAFEQRLHLSREMQLPPGHGAAIHFQLLASPGTENAQSSSMSHSWPSFKIRSTSSASSQLLATTQRFLAVLHKKLKGQSRSLLQVWLAVIWNGWK